MPTPKALWWKVAETSRSITCTNTTLCEIIKMNSENSPLGELLVSQDSIATDVVANAIRGLVTIVKETGEVVASPALENLDYNSKILAFLLGRRAATILGVTDKVAADADTIAAFVGLEPQRARENLSRLKRKFLFKDADGWSLPVPRVPVACEELAKKRR
jgi:hypothetical protein